MTDPVRLTLSQAYERIDAIARREGVPISVDWGAPTKAARALAIKVADLPAFSRSSMAAAEVIDALDAYAAHLAFEAGRDFELKAVQNAVAEACEAAVHRSGTDALAAFADVLTAGLHHAEG